MDSEHLCGSFKDLELFELDLRYQMALCQSELGFHGLASILWKSTINCCKDVEHIEIPNKLMGEILIRYAREVVLRFEYAMRGDDDWVSGLIAEHGILLKLAHNAFKRAFSLNPGDEDLESLMGKADLFLLDYNDWKNHRGPVKQHA